MVAASKTLFFNILLLPFIQRIRSTAMGEDSFFQILALYQWRSRQVTDRELRELSFNQEHRPIGTANHYLRSLPGHSNLLDAPAEQPSCPFAQGDLLLHRYCELDGIASQSSHLLRRLGSELCPHTGHTLCCFGSVTWSLIIHRGNVEKAYFVAMFCRFFPLR